MSPLDWLVSQPRCALNVLTLEPSYKHRGGYSSDASDATGATDFAECFNITEGRRVYYPATAGRAYLEGCYAPIFAQVIQILL